ERDRLLEADRRDDPLRDQRISRTELRDVRTGHEIEREVHAEKREVSDAPHEALQGGTDRVINEGHRLDTDDDECVRAELRGVVEQVAADAVDALTGAWLG